MTGLGESLRRLRKRNGMTQQQVADYLCIHRTTYTKYESDRTEPSLETVRALAERWQVSLEELLPQA